MDGAQARAGAAGVNYDPGKCAERMGKLTASKAGVIMGALTTSGLETYCKTLAWERVFGAKDAEYRNAAMDRGNEMEALALDWYEFETGATLLRSPGVIVAGKPARTTQVKCPLHGAYMDTKRTWRVPSEYRWQCKWELWCVALADGDFVTWHPMPGGIILPISVTPDECAAMAERAEVVNKMVEKWVDILQDRSEAA